MVLQATSRCGLLFPQCQVNRSPTLLRWECRPAAGATPGCDLSALLCSFAEHQSSWASRQPGPTSWTAF